MPTFNIWILLMAMLAYALGFFFGVQAYFNLVMRNPNIMFEKWERAGILKVRAVKVDNNPTP